MPIPEPIPLQTILTYYQTGDIPTQEQFQASWSSFWHKLDKLPISSVEGLETALQNKLDKSTYNLHLTNTDAHSTTLAKLDASNLNANNIQEWKAILEVGTLPSNIGTVDEGLIQGNVYTKQQALELFMMLEDFVNGDGKILASKIEALGLTELISVTETSLSAFIANNANYTYEKNDFIAIPNGSGNYSLYIYKGGSKTVSGNYLPTGLTNITIAMVEGLQAALDAKMDKPAVTGSFFGNKSAIGAQVAWRAINPSTAYLLLWNGNDFVASGIYTTGTKYGIGTTAPTEMLHLNDGRIRSKANVLDENNETLINQVTTYNRKLLFTDSTGTKKTVLTVEDLPTEFLKLPTVLNTTQKEQFGTAWNNQYSNGLINVYSITPTVMKNDHIVKYLVLQGLNLNVNPLNTTITFIPIGNALGVGEVNCLGFQTTAGGQTLIVSTYGDSLPAGVQYNIVIRISTPTIQVHRTASSISVVTNVDNIDLNTITWDLKAYTAGHENVFAMNSGLMAYTSDPANKAYAYEPNVIVAAAKSNPVFGLNSNFYMEVNFTVSNNQQNGPSDVNDFYGYFGLLQSSVPNVLADNSFLKMIFAGFRSGGYQSLIFYNNILSNDYRIVPQSTMTGGNLIVMRQGNIYTQFLTVAGQTIVLTYVGTVEAVSLALTVTNGTTLKTFNGSIVQAFTF